MATFRPDDRPSLVAMSLDAVARQSQLLQKTQATHGARMLADHGKRWVDLVERARALSAAMLGAQPGGAAASDARAEQTPAAQLMAYARDAGERAVLMLDLLRERAEQDAAHEAAGTPPVLIYDHEMILDGGSLERPCNYRLLRILPPAGVTVDDRLRPYMIIDPRAGHGAGIGGFKPDSQVGVALKAGHPVYFVAFGPHPMQGQTLADVMRAEAAFVREVRRRHPHSENPVVIGNCQGGWAALLLAAANPDITGPVVLNGAPVATWSGRVGENPMRYNGGLLGGIVPAMFFSDLNNGEFDGANLVTNFEMLNPSRNFIGKYYDMWRTVDSDQARARFLEFERWWGGYHFLAEEEIRWIVEQLFVGNRLARNEARLERGRELDIKGIRSPIIVFASHGDNITPPQQALNWIADTYVDEREIKVRGQRIVYMLHETVGHLGIFVSGSVAKREHREITSTLRTIETLAPGLYEMRVESVTGEGQGAQFEVSFAERAMADIRAIDDGQSDEVPAFAAVSRYSELWSELYELTARPFVQAMVTRESAQALGAMHPGRWTRAMFGEANPAMAMVPAAARKVRADRAAVGEDNMFRAAEALWMDAAMQAIDAWRDLRDMASEQSFYTFWSTPFMAWAGARNGFERTRRDASELRYLPSVEQAFARALDGGYPAAVVRMLLLVAGARGEVRRDRLERADTLFERGEPFRTMGAARLAQLIHEQSLLTEFEPQAALDTLPMLLPEPADRMRAMEAMLGVAGRLETLEPPVAAMVRAIMQRLDLPEPAPEPLDAGVAPAAGTTAAMALDETRAAHVPAAAADQDVEPAPAGAPPANAAA